MITHYNNCIVFQCFHTLARSVYGWHAQRALLMIASINWKSEVSTKKNEPKREKRDTAESIHIQKSGAALVVLPDRRRRPCENSEFWHLDKLNILDGSSLRWRWSYTTNSYEYNSNCYDFNSNYWQFEEKKSPMRRSSFFQRGPTLTTFYIVDEEREDPNTI